MSRVQAGAAFEQFLCDNIPLAHATGTKVDRFDDQGLQVIAPLAPNSNHHRTAFGGSLYVVALAAGWGLTYLLLQEANIRASLFVRSAQAEYLRPVTGQLIALANTPKPAELADFKQTYNTSGSADLTIRIHMDCNGKRAFELRAIIAARSGKKA